MSRVVAFLCALSCTVGLLLAPPAAEAYAAKRPVLKPTVVGKRTAVLSGRAPRAAVVRVQRLRHQRWTTFRRVRATHRSTFKVRIRRPAVTTRYRVVVRGRASRVRVVPGRPRPVSIAPAESTVLDACGPRPAKPGGGHWSCTFHDDFEGTDLDTSRWMAQETWFSGMTSGNRDCYVNDDKTVAVRDGALHLTARRNMEPFSCASPFGSFQTTSTASTVTTRNKFSQAYGRFSFRMKMPDQAGVPGAHSAAWLYPQDNRYGLWPLSGEIDVAEWWSARPANVYPSAHYFGEILGQSTGADCAMPTASTAYHVYTVEWSPSVLKFFYDGSLCFTHQWSLITKTLQPFDHPFNLVLTQVWGSGWNAPTSATPHTATLKVDWARAWE